MKICVFPNDPLIAYYNKGEIKERYFNPCNIFDEIHVISFSDEEIEANKVRIMGGSADFIIHTIGKINPINKSKKKKEIIKLLGSIKPDVIRSYNSFLSGWIAANCSKELNIPFFLSLHVQYDGLRKQLSSKGYKKRIALKYSEKKIEPFVLSNADKITIVYKIIEPYVKRLCDKQCEVLYNRVDLKRFHNAKKTLNYKKPIILTVGRLTQQKNHDILIRSIKDIDAILFIIGDGELKESLKKVVLQYDLENKVIFKESVPNNQIQDYYKSADVFVLAYNPEIEGLPIPVIEALASGLPIIIPKPIEGLSDGLDDCVCFSRLDSESFGNTIKEILNDKEFSQKLSEKAIEKSKEFDGMKIEEREAEIYRELIKMKKSQ